MSFLVQFLLTASFITLHFAHYWAVLSFLDSEVTFFWLVGKLTLLAFFFAVCTLLINVVWMAVKKAVKYVK
jgi:hypothetical protein